MANRSKYFFLDHRISKKNFHTQHQRIGFLKSPSDMVDHQLSNEVVVGVLIVVVRKAEKISALHPNENLYQEHGSFCTRYANSTEKLLLEMGRRIAGPLL